MTRTKGCLAGWVMISWRVIIITCAALSVKYEVAAASDAASRASRDWPIVGADLANTRYSELDQVNRNNVAGLGAVWISSRFDEGGMSKVTPVVSGGMMFVTAGRQIYALNAKTGRRVWTYKTLPDHDIDGGGQRVQEYNNTLVSAAGVPNWRGVSVARGLVFAGLMDGHVIALTAQTGKLVWSRQMGVDQPRVGQWASTAPTYVDGNVFAGLSDGDHSLRGRFTDLDADTGKQIWQRFAIPAPGEPGHASWPSFNDTWKTGGGGVWTNAPVDPELSLVYFTTGNPVPTYAGDLRPGDNLYTCSVLAFDIRTGALKWYYQLVHHDVFEADLGTPVILYDMQVAGGVRKALAVLRADGYLFELDRETGKPILPVQELPVPQSALQKTSPTQPFPVGAESVLMSCDEWKQERLPAGFVLGCMFTPPASPPPSTDPQNVLVPFPAAKGPLMAYSPQTGYFYTQGWSHLSWPRRSQDPYFLNLYASIPGLREYGDIVAIDSRTGKRAWRKRVPFSSLAGGPIVTAGGLMFRSSGDGNVEAYDAATGDVLWHFQTGTVGAGGPPSTYEIDGEQYVAVAMGSAIWAFKLGGQIPAAPVPVSRAEPDPFFSGPIVDSTEIETTSLERTLVEPGKRYFIDEYTFNPYRTRVKAGSRVLFVNNGMMQHEIVALDGSWGTGPLGPTEQAWVAFEKSGEYTYICKDHPWSYGQIIVTAKDAVATASRRTGRVTTQVAQGQEHYYRSCSTCHGESLSGNTTAPALVGTSFMRHWETATVEDLFDRIRTTMPQGNPGSLDRETYMGILAYLLQVNNVSTGRWELNSDPKMLRLMKLRWPRHPAQVAGGESR